MTENIGVNLLSIAHEASDNYRRKEREAVATKRETPYDYDTTTLDSNLRRFSKVCSKGDYESIVARCEKQKRGLRVLELMGSGGVFYLDGGKRLKVSGEVVEGAALTLVDRRPKQNRPDRKIYVLEGDILDNSLQGPWKKLIELKDNEFVGGFDLILLRPEADGFESLGYAPDRRQVSELGYESFIHYYRDWFKMYFSLMNSGYSLLATEGLMLTQWPAHEYSPTTHLINWMNDTHNSQLIRNPGLLLKGLFGPSVYPLEITVGIQDPSISSEVQVKLVKHAKAPDELGPNPFNLA